MGSIEPGEEPLEIGESEELEEKARKRKRAGPEVLKKRGLIER